MLDRYFKGITMPSVLSKSENGLFPNQIETANNLIYAFMNDEFSYAMLIALMQSGKTGVFMLVGAELIRLGFIDAFVVLCASADTELVDQLNNPKDFWRSYRKYLRNDKHLDPDSVDEIVSNMEDKYSCLCGRKLNNSFVAQGKTLFITDESHYGQSCKQQLDAFYKKMGLQPDGSKSENGHLILSVSATPFSETIDNDHFNQNKFVVKMDVESGYWGIKDMFRAKKIQEFKKEHIAVRIQELVRSSYDRGPNIGWFRSRGKGNNQEVVEKECILRGVKFILYDQEYKEKHIEEVVNETDPMCIFLKNRISMGKLLPGKINTLWAIETNYSNLDTTLQGLLGRICGYSSTGSGEHITMYLPKKAIVMIDKSGYLEFMHNDLHGNFIRSMNTSKSIKTKPLNPTIPEILRIPLNPDSWDVNKGDHKSLIRDYVRSPMFNDTSKNYDIFPGSTNKLKEDIENINNISLSNLEKGSYQSHKTRMDEYHTKNELLDKTGSGCGFESLSSAVIRAWYEKMPTKSSNEWIVYLQFRSNVAPPPGVFRYGTAKTTGKEIFQHRNSDGSIVHQNGSLAFGLRPETATNVSCMQASMVEAIDMSQRPSELQSYNRISSEQSSTTSEVNGILVNDEVYKALLPRGHIYKYILERHEKKLTLHKFNGRPPSNLPSWCKTRLSSISWE